MRLALHGLVCIAILLALLVSCQNNDKPSPIQSAKIAYFRDARTGLCFAAINSLVSGGYATSVTNVPCSAEVLRLAGDQ